jgi:hypothetical protein
MKRMLSKPVLLLFIALSLCFSLAGSAYAFSDVKNDPEKAAIDSLKKDGVLKGNGQGKFEPKSTMYVGTAVALIVKGMDLNIDNMRFIKEPKASDYFTKVKDNAWYAQAFIIAHLNGLEIPKDIDPAAKATREQFSHWLYKAIERHGEYVWTEIYFMMKDKSQVNPDYMPSIQRLLNGKIASLDAGQNFRPKQAVTRSEAAGMLHRARDLAKNAKPVEPVEPVDPEKSVLKDTKITTEKVNEDLLKVTVTATVPHPGYSFEIAGIDFRGDQAFIHYRLILPDPAAFYPQVLREVSAVTYISSKYKAVLGEQEPARMRKQETDNGTVQVPVEPQQTPETTPSTKHPVKDGTTGNAGGTPSGW